MRLHNALKSQSASTNMASGRVLGCKDRFVLQKKPLQELSVIEMREPGRKVYDPAPRQPRRLVMLKRQGESPFPNAPFGVNPEKCPGTYSTHGTFPPARRRPCREPGSDPPNATCQVGGQ